MQKHCLPLASLRRWLLPALLLAGASTAAQAQNNVGVGTTTPHPSAVLDASSTSQGLLAPRMSQTQRNAIGNPATGLLVYQTDNTPGFYVYTGSAWAAVAGSGGTGPQGPAGPTGATGPAGPAGPQGPIGNTGPAGATGAQGPIGNTGPAGATGAQGPIGATGATGATGNTGPAGATGAQGPIGNTGPAGATGATGAQGPIGNTGPQGATGATGAQGPIGNTGPQGPIGNTGPAGATGAVGPAGPTGPTGATGPGVPTGGTAGQVLSKIDATNYNTQWVTPSAGSGPQVLAVYKNVAQTTNVGSSLVAPDVVTFEAAETFSNMSATVGTWTGNNTFTAKQNGWYLVDVQFTSNITFGAPLLDFNGSGATSATSYYGTGIIMSVTAQTPYKGRGMLQRLVYMTANQTFQIRATPGSSVVGVDLNGNNSTYLRVTQL